MNDNKDYKLTDLLTLGPYPRNPYDNAFSFGDYYYKNKFSNCSLYRNF